MKDDLPARLEKIAGYFPRIEEHKRETCREAIAELESLTAENRALREEILRGYMIHDNNGQWCAFCYSTLSQGHAKNCIVDSLLTQEAGSDQHTGEHHDN